MFFLKSVIILLQFFWKKLFILCEEKKWLLSIEERKIIIITKFAFELLCSFKVIYENVSKIFIVFISSHIHIL